MWLLGFPHEPLPLLPATHTASVEDSEASFSTLALATDCPCHIKPQENDLEENVSLITIENVIRGVTLVKFGKLTVPQLGGLQQNILTFTCSWQFYIMLRDKDIQPPI